MNDKRVNQAADRLISAFMKDELRHRCATHCAIATIGAGYLKRNCLEETGYENEELREIETKFEACGREGWGMHKKDVKGTNEVINTKEVAGFEALLECFKEIERLNPEYFVLEGKSIWDKALYLEVV